MSHGAVRVRLDVTDVQAGVLLRAAGARRFAFNWAVAKVKARRVRLAKYGWVRIAAACPAQAKLRRLLRRGHAVLQHITVSCHSDGRWYVTVTFSVAAGQAAAVLPGEAGT